MKKKVLIILGLIASVIISGCTISTPITAPSGKLGYTINCSGENMTKCYQKAGELCGHNGYTILKQKDREGGFFVGPDKRLIIECK